MRRCSVQQEEVVDLYRPFSGKGIFTKKTRMDSYEKCSSMLTGDAPFFGSSSMDLGNLAFWDHLVNTIRYRGQEAGDEQMRLLKFIMGSLLVPASKRICPICCLRSIKQKKMFIRSGKGKRTYPSLILHFITNSME